MPSRPFVFGTEPLAPPLPSTAVAQRFGDWAIPVRIAMPATAGSRVTVFRSNHRGPTVPDLPTGWEIPFARPAGIFRRAPRAAAAGGGWSAGSNSCTGYERCPSTIAWVECSPECDLRTGIARHTHPGQCHRRRAVALPTPRCRPGYEPGFLEQWHQNQTDQPAAG